jgi:hypothetical protein
MPAGIKISLETKRRVLAMKKSFDELQEDGAAKFGTNWLVIQRAIAETAGLNGINPAQNKYALAQIAYKVLSLMEFSKQSTSNPK